MDPTSDSPPASFEEAPPALPLKTSGKSTITLSYLHPWRAGGVGAFLGFISGALWAPWIWYSESILLEMREKVGELSPELQEIGSFGLTPLMVALISPLAGALSGLVAWLLAAVLYNLAAYFMGGLKFTIKKETL